MNLTALILMTVAVPPTPSGTNDITLAVYYDHQPQQAVALAGSCASSIYMASWRLTDGTVCSALAASATRGIAVHVVYDGSSGTNDAQWIATRSIVTSGGTVVAAHFAHQIANNFMAGDGVYTLSGNYYYTPTAVQIGSYSAAISGTNTAFTSVTTWNSLASGGTITASFRHEHEQCDTLANMCGQILPIFHAEPCSLAALYRGSRAQTTHSAATRNNRSGESRTRDERRDDPQHGGTAEAAGRSSAAAAASLHAVTAVSLRSRVSPGRRRSGLRPAPCARTSLWSGPGRRRLAPLRGSASYLGRSGSYLALARCHPWHRPAQSRGRPWPRLARQSRLSHSVPAAGRRQLPFQSVRRRLDHARAAQNNRSCCAAPVCV